MYPSFLSLTQVQDAYTHTHPVRVCVHVLAHVWVSGGFTVHCVLVSLLGINPKTSCILGKHTSAELHSQP